MVGGERAGDGRRASEYIDERAYERRAGDDCMGTGIVFADGGLCVPDTLDTNSTTTVCSSHT